MNFDTLNKQRKFILIAAAAGVISMFLPWISVSYFGISGSANGLHSYGILIFLAFIGAGAVAYMGDQTKSLERTMWFIALACGAIATLLSIYFWTDAGSVAGFGLYIGLLAAIGVLAAAWLFKAPGDDIKSGFDSLKKDIENKSKS